ncbi:MAG: carboxypeptidase-like regulatory domain-containing protein, partial [Candidatus Helarchaeota archaeon]|nr:carboxypeptidase-like regulatory domain-containing protein [Candidatus Helarchaeota archaeon]
MSIFLLIFLSFNMGIYAGTTGKVQGTILDSESNEPLPGVNIMIEGTTLGAATDESGFFFIINIPPGTYSLKASMIGYA